MMYTDDFVPVPTDPDVLWDASTYKNHHERLSQKLYPRIRMTDSQYQVMQAVLHDPRLKFNGDLDALTREAYTMLLRYYADFLENDKRTLLHHIRETQTRLSNERYAVTFEDKIEEQLANLRVWTAVKEWGAVLDSLKYWDEQMASYPHRAWSARVAHIWLSAEGLKPLMKVWYEEMEPAVWQAIQKVIGKWERMARL